MIIHHLNAGTMCPVSAQLVNGSGGLFQRARLVCHVLLLETTEGLILVDTGLGLGDIAAPTRLDLAWRLLASPQLKKEETVFHQVQELGFSVGDVRHILLTHLDLDHAGGIADFPQAKIHIHSSEYRAAISGEIPVDTKRYVPLQWQGREKWEIYGSEGETWFGFQGVRALGEQGPEILIIPLPGHTAGHCGVAVRGPEKWLLHAGDSYYFHGQIKTPPQKAPAALGYFQRKADMLHVQRLENQERVRELNHHHADEITIINSHDPYHLDCCAKRTP